MAASSNSVPRISLRGREFRLVENGEEIARFRDKLDVVILGIEPGPNLMAKAWYANGYTSGAKEPPDCMSDDGISPPSWVKNRQSDQCSTCEKNKFGSGKSPSGKATKACRDSKRAWLKIADGNVIDGKPFQQKSFADRTMFGLNVTVASLRSFSDHGRMLAGLGVAPAVAVTRLNMLDMEYPQLSFEVTAWLDADTAPESLKIANAKPWKLFKAVGLALAAPDGSSKPGLPANLPAHIQAIAQPVEDAVEVASKPVKAVADSDIDDAVSKF
jgi:hypothetical protein